MTIEMKKVWFDGEKVVTQNILESDIYKRHWDIASCKAYAEQLRDKNRANTAEHAAEAIEYLLALALDKECVAAQRKAIYDLDCCLWRARAEAERDSNYHTQLGHAIGALESLKAMFNIPTPSPDTFGTRSWFTVDELNAWAEAKLKQKNGYAEEKNNG